MLVIRDEQMQAFSFNARNRFEADTVRHISGFAPGRFAVLGEKTIGQIVNLGIALAEKHGFTNRGPARFYVELMFMFGSDFDTDPQYPWAAEALSGQESGDQVERADRLYQDMLRYREQVVGKNLEHEREALNRLVGLPPVAWALSGADTSGIASLLRKIYPEKCEFLGDAPLEYLVQRGVSLAAAYPGSSKAASIFTELMFFFGHGCLTDSQFPWIAAILERGATGDEKEKMERLYSKNRILLQNALIGVEEKPTLPLSGCEIPVNPAGVEDACTPVAHTTVTGSGRAPK
ncbi:MAG: hypothetical protein P4L43_04765 [Syntrophobacteraceae bacterium]|nr:hypothetical protein [Syntrophobacteraceae bacterium]